MIVYHNTWSHIRCTNNIMFTHLVYVLSKEINFVRVSCIIRTNKMVLIVLELAIKKKKKKHSITNNDNNNNIIIIRY